MPKQQIYLIASLYLGIMFTSQAAPQSEQCTGGCILQNRSDDQNCDLDKTPLSRCGGLSQFKKIDVGLNNEYRRLLRQLKPADKKALQRAQREWIRWRDEQCETEEADAHCDQGVCSGVAHDSCILDLTARRTKELQRFIQNVASGVDGGFAFSTGRTDEDPEL